MQINLRNCPQMSCIGNLCVKLHQFHVFQTFLHKLLRPISGFAATDFHFAHGPRIFYGGHYLFFYLLQLDVITGARGTDHPPFF
jgi:hypothetical protein